MKPSYEKLEARIAELERNENKYKILYENVGDYIFMIKFDENKIPIIIDGNEFAFEKHGYSREELIGKPITNLDTDKFKEKLYEIPLKLNNHGDQTLFESEHICKDGTIFPVEIKARYVDTGDGNPYFILVEQDISNHKKAEDALKESEDKFRSYFNADPIAIFIWKYINDDFFLLDVNETANRITENKAKNFIGLSAKQIYADLPIIREKLFECLSTKSTIEFEFYYLARYSNEYEWIRFKFTYLDPNMIILYSETITNQKKTEIELIREKEKAEESEQRLKLAAIAGQLGIWDWNIKENVMVWDDRMFELYGLNRDTFSSNIDAWMNGLHPEDKQRAIDECNFALYKNKEFDTTFRVLHPDGKILHLKANGLVIKDSEGNPIRMLGINSDITDKKKAEEALLNAKEYAEELIQTANAMIVGLDVDGNITVFNEAAMIISGYTKQDLEGKNWFEILVPKEKYPYVWEEFARLKEKGVPKSFENPILRKDGQERIIAWQNSVLFDNNGASKGTISFGIDITERLKAEEKIREQDIQFRKLSDNIPDMIFQFTRKPDGSYCVPIASKGIKSVFGCSPDDVLNDFTPIRRVIYPEDLERVINDIEYSSEHQTTLSCEFRVQIPGKQIQWLYTNSVPEKLADGSVTWYGFCTDFTERKKAEELLQKQNQELETQYEEYMQLNEVLRQTNFDLSIAKEQAEESDKLKTAFLQNMSHEIRTPLNGIIGFSNLLQDDNIGRKEIIEYTDIIQKSGLRLIEIVNNVLDISKIETGQIKINKKVFPVNSVFNDLLTFFGPIANSKNISLNYNNLDDTLLTLYSDESKLNQIISNLISNSLKFTKSGSIDFGFKVIKDKIQFYVKDTGIGIPKEYFNMIFDRFTQIDLKITRGYEGAGLGLAICKGLIELLGGEIWVESEVNVGTTFFFTLPYNPDNLRTKIESVNNETNGKLSPGKILIAEDDWTSFQYISKILTQSNIMFLHALNGEQAIEYVKTNPDINMILMDIKMPELNGIEATKIIKELRPELPIIAQTAYAFSSEKEEIMSIGCSDYISKPITKKDLLKLIEKYSKK